MYANPVKEQHRMKRERDQQKAQQKRQTLLKRIHGARMSNHAAERSNERQITNKQIKKVLTSGHVHEDKDRNALLVQHQKTTVVIDKPRFIKRLKSENNAGAVVNVITVYKH